jgi:hypothetical protein
MVWELTMTKRKNHLPGSQILTSYLQHLQAHSPSLSFKNISPTLGNWTQGAEGWLEPSEDCWKIACNATCFHAGFLLGLFFRSWRWRRYVPPKRLLTFNGLHCVIFQKIVLIITTVVGTSNPTKGKSSTRSNIWKINWRRKQKRFNLIVCIVNRHTA